MTLARSPLAARHEALGANLVEFGGWEMPIAYPAGTIEEHLACRNAAALDRAIVKVTAKSLLAGTGRTSRLSMSMSPP